MINDLVAYLGVGDGVRPYERDGTGAVLKESTILQVLETAIAASTGHRPTLRSTPSAANCATRGRYRIEEHQRNRR